jgi:hypothetical protein
VVKNARTIAYDCVLKRPGCVLLQAVYGATIDRFDMQKFPSESWLINPTPDLKVYPLTPEILQQLVRITIESMKGERGHG